MNRLALLLLITIGLIFGACGTNTKEDRYSKTYDMWRYMIPPSDTEVEYDIYKNHQKVDYFFEITKILPSKAVERTSGDEFTLLTPYSNQIHIDKRGKSRVEVQRFLKIGDTNIFQSPNLSCRADDYLYELKIKNSTFYQIIKVICQQKNIYSEIYYADNEGIVYLYEDNEGYITEKVKIREREL
jgi:hypothetical protein